MGFSLNDGECDVCGAKLDLEDKPVYLCKICQGMG